MIQLTKEFRANVAKELIKARTSFGGSDASFAKQFSLHSAIYCRLKNGETEGIIQDAKWIHIGRMLGVSSTERKWNIARTDVFTLIEEEIMFCKEFSKAKIMVDDCGIGKTFTAKYLARTIQNCFYVDASQAKTRQLFIRLIAQTVGVDSNGKYSDVKANLKYALHALPKSIIIVDEAGDLDYNAFLELKELWNATENVCGWYLMGAEGLKAKITAGINHKKVGFREIFSRFSEKYSSIVPAGKEDKIHFYRKLITDVLTANVTDSNIINQVVKKCLINDGGNIGGLRRAESILILNS